MRWLFWLGIVGIGGATAFALSRRGSSSTVPVGPNGELVSVRFPPRTYGELVAALAALPDSPPVQQLLAVIEGDVIAWSNPRTRDVLRAKAEALVAQYGPNAFAAGEIDTLIGPLFLVSRSDGLRIRL